MSLPLTCHCCGYCHLLILVVVPSLWLHCSHGCGLVSIMLSSSLSSALVMVASLSSMCCYHGPSHHGCHCIIAVAVVLSLLSPLVMGLLCHSLIIVVSWLQRYCSCIPIFDVLLLSSLCHGYIMVLDTLLSLVLDMSLWLCCSLVTVTSSVYCEVCQLSHWTWW